MIEQSKFIDMIKILDECLTVMSREAFHSDQESLLEVNDLIFNLKDHKSELDLILQIDLADKRNSFNIAINNTTPVTSSNLIAGIAADAYADAENTVQRVKTFLRKKI